MADSIDKGTDYVQKEEYSVKIGKVINNFNLECVFMPQDGTNRRIYSKNVNRPGLQLAGYYEYYDNKRIQIFGNMEHTFLKRFTQEKRLAALEKLFSHSMPLAIVSTGLEIFPEMLEVAKKHGVPITRTQMTSSELLGGLIGMLNVDLAPRIQRHGVLVEVYGEGILILGESGVGKSETAIELVKRGHRLIADDAVEIRRVSQKTLVGTSPEIIRHFIELRGIGIVDVRRIFGMGAVKQTEKIDMVIQLEVWDDSKFYDRLGLDEESIEILGNRVPSLTVPVKPGRNLAMIIEVAAMNNRQKKMGYNAAEEMNRRLMSQFSGEDNE